MPFFKSLHFPSAFNSSPVLPPCLRRSLLENFESVEMLLEVNPSHVYEFNLTASSFKLPELALLLHPSIIDAPKGGIATVV
jgi:hypothetical protein